MADIVKSAAELLEGKQDVVLATIVNQQGSSPRTAGTRMLITRDQKIIGTIGGGILEARVMAAGEDILNGAPPRFMGFNLNNQDAAVMGMVCGGNVNVLVDPLRSTEENTALFKSWQQALASGENCFFLSVIAATGETVHDIAHCLVRANGQRQGHCPLSSGALDALIQAGKRSTASQVVKSMEDFLVVMETSCKPKRVYLFGAGHVAQPTAHLASLVGFQVSVLDDREVFAHADRFPSADDLHILPDYDGALAELSVDGDAYIVIVTRGHLHDQEVLGWALKTPAAYIGMIGSRSKRDHIYDNLLAAGFTASDLTRVHSPIGLKIGAETPEEIGVSIVAEMIRFRAEAAKSEIHG